jgi:hypothetical protein
MTTHWQLINFNRKGHFNMTITIIHVTNFRALTKGKWVYVCDDPDPRYTRIILKLKVQANQPSQRLYKFAQGYIRFEDYRRYFDIERRVLTSRRKRDLCIETAAYIFEPTLTMRLLYSRHHIKCGIEEWISSASAADRTALEDCLIELVLPNAHRSSLGKDAIAACLEVIGISTLRDVLSMLRAEGRTRDLPTSIAA